MWENVIEKLIIFSSFFNKRFVTFNKNTICLYKVFHKKPQKRDHLSLSQWKYFYTFYILNNM